MIIIHGVDFISHLGEERTASGGFLSAALVLQRGVTVTQAVFLRFYNAKKPRRCLAVRCAKYFNYPWRNWCRRSFSPRVNLVGCQPSFLCCLFPASCRTLPISQQWLKNKFNFLFIASSRRTVQFLYYWRHCSAKYTHPMWSFRISINLQLRKEFLYQQRQLTWPLETLIVLTIKCTPV